MWKKERIYPPRFKSESKEQESSSSSSSSSGASSKKRKSPPEPQATKTPPKKKRRTERLSSSSSGGHQTFSSSSPREEKKRTLPPKERDWGDSSDEEEIDERRQSYDLMDAIKSNEFDKFLNWMVQEFREIEGYEGKSLTKKQVLKSFLLHSVGRMAIYSPDVGNKARIKKEKLLTSTLDKQFKGFDTRWGEPKIPRKMMKESKLPKKGIHGATGKIDEQDGHPFVICDLKDLLAFGRTLRRNQIRKSRNIYDMYSVDSDFCYKPQLREVSVRFGSYGNDNIAANVTETLVVSNNGLSRGGGFPKTDMVHLMLQGVTFSGEGKRYDNADTRSSESYKAAGREASKIQPKAILASIIGACGELKSNPNTQKEKKEAINQCLSALKKIEDDLIPYLGDEKQRHHFVADSIQKACLGECIDFPFEGTKEQRSIKDKIYILTYLLFKTEVFRSPAGLVNHMQMLELIKERKMTFKQAFGSEDKDSINEMPLSDRGIIRSARILNRIYNSKFYAFRSRNFSYDAAYMIPEDICNTPRRGAIDAFYRFNNPYKYYSPKEETSFEKQVRIAKERRGVVTLIQKESALMDKWLVLQLPRSARIRVEIPDVQRFVDSLSNKKISRVKMVYDEILALVTERFRLNLEKRQQVAMEVNDEEEDRGSLPSPQAVQSPNPQVEQERETAR